MIRFSESFSFHHFWVVVLNKKLVVILLSKLTYITKAANDVCFCCLQEIQ